jgi:outer membrane protein assembly factor BamD
LRTGSGSSSVRARSMKRFLLLVLAVVGLLGVACPPDCPAPLIWRKGEGWTDERSGMVVGTSPKEQLEIAQAFQRRKEYGSAVSAYRRLLKKWPQSFAAPDARIGLAESLASLRYFYKAFKEYQQLIDKHPNTDRFELVLQRQFEIGNLFLAGERDKAFGLKWFPAPEKAVEIFEQVVKNGPYSKVGPLAQYQLGLTHERMRDYLLAVKSYEKLLERYPNDPLAESAQFEVGEAYRKEALRAEYDQNAANQAIAAFSDFVVRFPQSSKAARAEQCLAGLKEEQSRGTYQIGQFYEKNKKYKAALLYYSDVIEQNPKSDWATSAKSKVAVLSDRVISTARVVAPGSTAP